MKKFCKLAILAIVFCLSSFGLVACDLNANTTPLTDQPAADNTITDNTDNTSETDKTNNSSGNTSGNTSSGNSGTSTNKKPSNSTNTNPEPNNNNNNNNNPDKDSNNNNDNNDNNNGNNNNDDNTQTGCQCQNCHCGDEPLVDLTGDCATHTIADEAEPTFSYKYTYKYQIQYQYNKTKYTRDDHIDYLIEVFTCPAAPYDARHCTYRITPILADDAEVNTITPPVPAINNSQCPCAADCECKEQQPVLADTADCPHPRETDPEKITKIKVNDDYSLIVLPCQNAPYDYRYYQYAVIPTEHTLDDGTESTTWQSLDEQYYLCVSKTSWRYNNDYKDNTKVTYTNNTISFNDIGNSTLLFVYDPIRDALIRGIINNNQVELKNIILYLQK